MAFGYIFILGQMDARPGDGRTTIVVIFLTAIALFVVPILRLRNSTWWSKLGLLPIIGLQIAVCLYIISHELFL
jgi:hypothetical protein